MAPQSKRRAECTLPMKSKFHIVPKKSEVIIGIDSVWSNSFGTKWIFLDFGQMYTYILFLYVICYMLFIASWLLEILLWPWLVDSELEPQQSTEPLRKLIIMACVVLHNFLTGDSDIPALYHRLNPDNLPYLHDDGAILAVLNLPGFHTPAQAKAIRDIYMTYFNRPEGALPWQHRAALN